MIHVTNHAVLRWQERIARISAEDVRATIEASSPAIEAAASFGAACIRLGCGAKLVLDGRTVVTVLPRGWIHAGRLKGPTPGEQA